MTSQVDNTDMGSSILPIPLSLRKGKILNITILSIDIKTVPTAKGSYQTAEVAYKNNSFQGKVEGKKVVSFGNSKDAFATLATAAPGDTFEVAVTKNAQGYNDWVKLIKATPDTATPETTPVANNSGSSKPTPKSTYETPEERAQRQVLIVRQSSIANAVATLVAGAKVPPAGTSVIALAKEYEAYVLGIKSPGPSGFEDLPDFDVAIPKVE